MIRFQKTFSFKAIQNFLQNFLFKFLVISKFNKNQFEQKFRNEIVYIYCLNLISKLIFSVFSIDFDLNIYFYLNKKKTLFYYVNKFIYSDLLNQKLKFLIFL